MLLPEKETLQEVSTFRTLFENFGNNTRLHKSQIISEVFEMKSLQIESSLKIVAFLCNFVSIQCYEVLKIDMTQQNFR